jgi:hypothetical protein
MDFGDSVRNFIWNVSNVDFSWLYIFAFFQLKRLPPFVVRHHHFLGSEVPKKIGGNGFFIHCRVAGSMKRNGDLSVSS